MNAPRMTVRPTPRRAVTRGAIRPDAQKFVDYVLSPEGQRILESEGLVRAGGER